MSRSTGERTYPPIPPADRSPGRKGNTVLPEHDIPQDTIRTIRAVHSKLTEGRHMGLSTDEGISRGELQEELQAFEQRLDKRLDERFKDIDDALDTVNQALSVILAQRGASGRWWRPGW